MPDFSGKSEARRLEQQISALEREVRDLKEAWNRQAPKSRGSQGLVPRLTKFDIIRTEDLLQVNWGAVAMPDLRFYEVQIARKSNFASPITIQTPDPYATFTTGFGMIGFYFYVRARAVSNDRRPGPWTAKVETPAPDAGRASPTSGVMHLSRRTDVFVVGGSAQTITRITGGWVGRCVTLYFTVAHTVQDGSRLRLEGNFVAAVNSTLTLRYAGDSIGWVEVARTGTI